MSMATAVSAGRIKVRADAIGIVAAAACAAVTQPAASAERLVPDGVKTGEKLRGCGDARNARNSRPVRVPPVLLKYSGVLSATS